MGINACSAQKLIWTHLPKKHNFLKIFEEEMFLQNLTTFWEFIFRIINSKVIFKSLIVTDNTSRGDLQAWMAFFSY